MDVFYDEIIKEAALGKIDCGFLIPICFDTKILEQGKLKDLTTAKYYYNVMAPTLIIKNKEQLNESMTNYANLARDFYSQDERVLDSSNAQKYILTSCLVNALPNDFNDLNKLFERYSNFITDTSLSDFLETRDIGYSNILKSNILVTLEKQSVVEETPYAFHIELIGENNKKYTLPDVRFGISNGKAYVYAIQNMDKGDKDKTIERKMRKVGQGFDESSTSRDPINNPENLYSVGPWDLISLAVTIPLISTYSNVEEFVAPYFLVNRWNAVEISHQLLKEKYNGDLDNPIVQRRLEKIKTHDSVQRNITDKFIRSFRRMGHHFSNIEIDSFPLEMDSSLHFKVYNEMVCNNDLLGEIYSLSQNYKSIGKGVK